MKRPWVGLWAVILIAGLLAVGCASTSKIRSTRATLDRAKAAGAVDKAPFEYNAAEAYLKKAVVEAEEGDSKAAESFRQQSEEYAVKALEMSGGGAK